MNNKIIIVLDVETNNNDETIANIIQLGSIAIDPRNLKIIEGSEFNMNMRPDPTTHNQETIQFHCKRLNKIQDEVLKEWNLYPEPKTVWSEYIQYLQRYHTKQDRQTMFTAPIAAGSNIIKFDIPIINRYHELYGNKKALFNPRDKIDLIHLLFPWFENSNELSNFQMDTLRDYLGISKSKAHDALQDVKDCAEIIVRFLKLYRIFSPKVKFKNSFKKNN